MADELLNDNFLSDLGHERQVRDRTTILKVAGVDLRFFLEAASGWRAFVTRVDGLHAVMR